MEKESTGGQWRLADGSDVPASFDFEWSQREIPNEGYDFMSVSCPEGHLLNYSNNGYNLNFICQDK